jgi:hypothetical protein
MNRREQSLSDEDPQPLLESGERVASFLRAYARRTAAGVPLPGAWTGPRPRARWWKPAVVVVAGAAPAFLLATLLLPSPSPPPPAVSARTPSAETPAVPTVAPAQVVRRLAVAAGGPAARLPAGETVELAGRATVRLSAGGEASADAAQGLRVRLGYGQVSLGVQHLDEGPEVRVEAAPYTFAVLGTAFVVERTPVIVELRVLEGRVAVRRGATQLEVVAGGGRWRGLVSPGPEWASEPRGRTSAGPAPAAPGATVAAGATAPEAVPPAVAPTALRGTATPPARAVAAPPPPPTALPPPAPGCDALAGQGDAAVVACLLRQSEGGGLKAELSLFEAARLERDRLSDAAGALALLRGHHTRFPEGALVAEVDLAIVDLLPRLGRYQEALLEIARVLPTAGGRERRGELELLRGNVYREGLADWGRAEAAYAAALAAGPEELAAEARFLRATCLEALGRREEALAGYREVAAAGGKRAGEARARMAKVGGGR